MYKAMYELLTGYAPLTAIIPAESFYEEGALIDRPPLPYAILVWLPQLDKGRRTFTNPFELHTYDERGSHARLRQASIAVKACLEGVAQYQGTDGVIVQCDYVGNGGDLFDQDTQTNLQFTGWEIVGRTT